MVGLPAYAHAAAATDPGRPSGLPPKTPIAPTPPKPNPSMVLVGPRTFELRTPTLPPPEPHHLQITLHTTTLCGSDLHYYTSFSSAPVPCRVPLILGHESVGTVTALPATTKASTMHFRLGDRVAIECGIPCALPHCAYCNKNRYNLCAGLKFRSSARGCSVAGEGEGDGGGMLQRRVNHPAKWVHRLADSVSWRAGALLEPLSVAIHAVGRVGEEMFGKRVLVRGAGPVGILTAGVCAVRGAGVALVDVDERRLGVARELGWEGVGVWMDGEEPRAEAGEWDVAFECSGVEASVVAAIESVRPGGCVVMVGLGKGTLTVPLGKAAVREVDVKGSFRYAGAYPQAIEMVESGKLKGLEKIVTHSFRGMENAKEAFEMAVKGVDEEGRPVVKVEIVYDDEKPVDSGLA